MPELKLEGPKKKKGKRKLKLEVRKPSWCLLYYFYCPNPECRHRITAEDTPDSLYGKQACPECGFEFMGKARDTAKSPGRGINWEREELRDRILLEMVQHPEGTSGRKLADALGVNKTTVNNLVKELVDEGAIHRDGRKLFPVR